MCLFGLESVSPLHQLLGWGHALGALKLIIKWPGTSSLSEEASTIYSANLQDAGFPV